MRLPVLEARHGGVALAKRSEKKKSIYVIGIIAVAIIAILLVTYLLTAKYRKRNALKGSENRSQHDRLPSLFSFRNWRSWGKRRHQYAGVQDNEMDRSSARDREMSGSLQDPERQTQQTANTRTSAGVDRNTSVRSVMTLPPYAATARENEQILGREGDRGGMDSVIEFPETQDDEETRREEEMESLYQIRLARRQEARAREERRQERRAARARGDYEALAEIRRRAEQAADESISQQLILEHSTANRERRVSSVQYGDLGVARHDGTRLRANSSESDNRPLLDSAASISGQSGRSRALSSNTLNTHHRVPSASSLVSSRTSDDFDFADAQQPRFSREHSNSDDFEVVSLDPPRSNSGSRTHSPLPSPSMEIPREQAPAYEDPPNYESPIRTRAPQLPTIERLPSIQVTTEPTPVEGRMWEGDLGMRHASSR